MSACFILPCRVPSEMVTTLATQVAPRAPVYPRPPGPTYPSASRPHLPLRLIRLPVGTGESRRDGAEQRQAATRPTCLANR